MICLALICAICLGQLERDEKDIDATSVTNGSQLSAQITSPASGHILRGDQEVVFDSVVTGGKEPYSYRWSSNVDGTLSSDKSFTIKAINLTGGEHHIILDVKDASGQSAERTILIWATSDNTSQLSEKVTSLSTNYNDASGQSAQEAISTAVFNETKTNNSNLSTRIISPADGYILSGDKEVVFDSLALGGQEPYSYEWSSNLDGILSSNKSFNQSAISLTKGEHHIILEVKDASGQSAQSTLIAWVM